MNVRGDLAKRVKQKYKAIASQDLAVVDSRDQGISEGRKLELYPPDEANNPVPGRITVEIFDPSFQGEDLDRMIAADFLHYAGKHNPALIDLREKFRRSLTAEQKATDRRAYERAKAGEFGEPEQRPYDEWFEIHRLDQYLGSMMLPKDSANRKEWMSGMTPEQKRILTRIEQYLLKGR